VTVTVWARGRGTATGKRRRATSRWRVVAETLAASWQLDKANDHGLGVLQPQDACVAHVGHVEYHVARSILLLDSKLIEADHFTQVAT
jgi:hypothetical protein